MREREGEGGRERESEREGEREKMREGGRVCEREREGEGEREKVREREGGRESVCVHPLFYFPLTSIPFMITMHAQSRKCLTNTNIIPHTHTDLAPAILPMGYNLVKHVLDEKTRKKIHFLGSELHKLELKLSYYK